MCNVIFKSIHVLFVYKVNMLCQWNKEEKWIWDLEDLLEYYTPIVEYTIRVVLSVFWDKHDSSSRQQGTEMDLLFIRISEL